MSLTPDNRHEVSQGIGHPGRSPGGGWPANYLFAVRMQVQIQITQICVTEPPFAGELALGV